MIEAQVIRQLATEAGFHACGVAQAKHDAYGAASLRAWLQSGYHADMHYMAQHEAMRCDPRRLLPGCKTVVSLLLGYKPDRTLHTPHRIAMYAYGEDYHEAMKRKLWQLLATLTERYPMLQGRPFVDTAPIGDKYWAVQAGLGYLGRNTLFLHPRYGSLVNIGELLLCDEVDCYDAPLPEGGDTLLAPQCQSCRRCVEACPNHALVPQQVDGREVWQLDARRCNSYHTIENRAERLPEGLNLRSYVYGCDYCQLVCPYNQAAPSTVAISPERIEMLESLPSADEAAFKKTVKHSAMNRIKYPQWQRNIRTKMQVER